MMNFSAYDPGTIIKISNEDDLELVFWEWGEREFSFNFLSVCYSPTK